MKGSCQSFLFFIHSVLELITSQVELICQKKVGKIRIGYIRDTSIWK